MKISVNTGRYIMVVEIKVYDWDSSLNQLINWFFYAIFFFSLYIKTILFFANIFLKLIGKKLQWFDQRELEGQRWVKEADMNDWVNKFLIIS